MVSFVVVVTRRPLNHVLLRKFSIHHTTPSGPQFNVKMPSHQHINSHCGDRRILWQCGISYTGMVTSLYWIWALNPKTEVEWYVLCGSKCLQCENITFVSPTYWDRNKMTDISQATLSNACVLASMVTKNQSYFYLISTTLKPISTIPSGKLLILDMVRLVVYRVDCNNDVGLPAVGDSFLITGIIDHVYHVNTW